MSSNNQKETIDKGGGGRKCLQTWIYLFYQHTYKGNLRVSKQKEINEHIDKGSSLVNKQKGINYNQGGGVLADPDILVPSAHI